MTRFYKNEKSANLWMGWVEKKEWRKGKRTLYTQWDERMEILTNLVNHRISRLPLS